jgi:hypothetical protein
MYISKVGVKKRGAGGECLLSLAALARLAAALLAAGGELDQAGCCCFAA